MEIQHGKVHQGVVFETCGVTEFGGRGTPKHHFLHGHHNHPLLEQPTYSST
jgi:hypothetical protein